MDTAFPNLLIWAYYAVYYMNNHQYIWVSSKWIQHIYYAIIFFPWTCTCTKPQNGPCWLFIRSSKKVCIKHWREIISTNTLAMRVAFYFQMIGTQKHASSYMYRELIPFLAFPYREFHHAPMPNVKRRKNDSEYEILRFNANASFISIMPLPSIFIRRPA